MNEQSLAYCGLNCSICPALLATKSGKLEEKTKVAAEWSKAYKIDLKAEDINCTGCKSDGPKFSHCSKCEIRKCSIQKKLDNCGYCNEYVCENVKMVVDHVPEAKEALDTINKKL